MINKYIFFFLIFILLNNCSFDSKTGIWGDGEKEKKRISDLEKKQKEILEIEKIFTTEEIYSDIKELNNKILLSKPKKNSSWKMRGLNHQNFLGNIYLPRANDLFLKRKVGKDKFSIYTSVTPLLALNKNLIFSDDTGTIFYTNGQGKTIWKKNIYKKIYKKVYKNLVFSIFEDNLYVADNIGFVYSVSLNNGQINWIKNYGVPIKSNIKIFNNKIFLIDQDNKIISLSTVDGSLIWDILTISSFIKTQNLLSIAISDVGDLFAITSSGDIFKIQSDNGTIIWSRNAAESLYANATDFFRSSEIVIDNDQLYFSAENNFYSYDVNNGNTNWKANLHSIGTPIVSKNNIFVMTSNGYLVFIEKSTGEIVFSKNILKVLKRKKRETKITGFILGSGKIYSMTLNGYLIVTSATTGKTEFFKKIGQPNISPLMISNGKLYILTSGSKIIGLQ